MKHSYRRNTGDKDYGGHLEIPPTIPTIPSYKDMAQISGLFLYTSQNRYFAKINFKI
jgi:hypothetical protein